MRALLITNPLKALPAPIHICSMGLVQWMGSLVANADGQDRLVLSFFLCCRFCIPAETGAKVTSRLNKTLPPHTLRLPAEAKASPYGRPYRESCSSRKNVSRSGFDFQQTDSVQGMDR